MKNIIKVALVTSSVLLNAQVIPGINSKGGAMVLPEGKLKMGIKNISFSRENMYSGTSEVNNAENLDASVNMTLLALKYGVAKDIDIKILIPYKQIEASASLGSNDVAIDNSGIGDAIIMSRYAFIPMSDYGFQVSVGAGVKLPTGSTDSGFTKAPAFASGVNIPMPTQMGTGAFEYKAELGFSTVIDDTLRIDMHSMYTYRPLAENDYDFGDELSYDLSITKAVTNQINIGIEYNGKYNTETDMGNDTNTQLRSMLPFKAFSGTVGYVTPQIEFLPFSKPKVHVGVGVAFLANYNVKEYQPLEKQRLIVRLGYLF